MNRQTLLRLLVALPLVAGFPAGPVAAQVAVTEYEGATALGLALRQLGTSKRVLMIGAHPDDERTEVLSTLALGQGASVAYLSLTRGEGGQNGIGAELGEGLGLLRSEELLAARRLDGAQQFFTRAYDFGFSKNADETFRHWPRDSVLADVVAVVRHFRPDVILAVFTGTPQDGHGHHQVSGILAREAFDAAADPARFPEQIARGLRPHAASKLYQGLWRGGEGGDAHRLETGVFDPLFGRSFFQVAMASRSRHRSQDMGQVLEPGPRTNLLRLGASRGAGEGAVELFAGVDTTLAAHARSAGSGSAALLEEYAAKVAAARERFNPLAPGELTRELAEALTLLRRAADASRDPDFVFRLRTEREELERALWLASGLVLDAVAEDETVVPGQEFEITLTLWNGGQEAVPVVSLEPRLPAGWRAEALDPLASPLAPGSLLSRRFRVTVPADATTTEPYFLRAPRSGDLYRWPEERAGLGIPFEASPVQAVATAQLHDARVAAEQAATFRGLDKMVGEFRRPVRVVPGVAVTLQPGLAIVPLGQGGRDSLRFAVRLHAEAPGGARGAASLRVPSGWSVDPVSVPVEFGAPGEERLVEFRVRPAGGLDEGTFPVTAVFAEQGGRTYSRGLSLVDYPHTTPRPLYRDAAASVRAFQVRVPTALRVGYVSGPGDAVPAGLEQIGIRVEPLGPAELASADLGVYDVIVTGIRAYEVRPDLITHNQRLLDYARNGGTVIVQYNQYEYAEPGIAPFPVAMSRPHDRVTDEGAPVRLLLPEHPVLSTPNRITAADFEGWVQERGLYFLREWDDRFTPLLEMADPGEAPLRGGLLVAPYGEGTYVYTGLAFFRQLPAGVPGAYRLFANLLALGARN